MEAVQILFTASQYRLQQKLFVEMQQRKAEEEANKKKQTKDRNLKAFEESLHIQK